MSIKPVKYIFILMFVVFLNNNFCSAMSNNLHSAADTINIISKISFTISSSGWRTFEDLLINSYNHYFLKFSKLNDSIYTYHTLTFLNYYDYLNNKLIWKIIKIYIYKNILIMIKI